jgi:hypothetical protein
VHEQLKGQDASAGPGLGLFGGGECVSLVGQREGAVDLPGSAAYLVKGERQAVEQVPDVDEKGGRRDRCQRSEGGDEADEQELVSWSFVRLWGACRRGAA